MGTLLESIVTGPPSLGSREFAFLQSLILRTAGIHLGEQKRSLVEGRLARRLRHHGLRDYKPYIELLQQGDAAELLELINAITTNKTSFFREPHHFDYLVQHVFPAFTGRTIRIWSAGCSTGEEPYSIAMTARDARVNVDVLATDIDTNVLATASAGIYREDRIGDLPPDVLRRHFLRGEREKDGLCKVRPEVQRLVTFERVNLVDGAGWPARDAFDVIFCRNVIIYFNRETQDTLFRRFAERLRPGGAMIVGHSENLTWLPELFEPVGKTVYRRHGGAPPHPASLPVRSPARALPETFAPPATPARRLVRIEAGGVHAARLPTEIRTVLGSCVAACVYDPATGIGGMNHFMLPTGESGERPARFGVHAMELLINDIMKLGGERARLRAKVFGGAAVLQALRAGVDVGRRNAEFIREFLAAERIPIDAEQLGGSHPLEVRFTTDNGKARVRALDAADDLLAELFEP